jgi:hypothetical protein
MGEQDKYPPPHTASHAEGDRNLGASQTDRVVGVLESMVQAEDRRAVDNSWKASVDTKLQEGVDKFTSLEEGQKELARAIADNTATTQETQNKLVRHMETTAKISAKMDEHVTKYDEFTTKMEPAVIAIKTMESGVNAIGKFSDGLVWTGKWFRRIVVWLTPIAAFIASVWFLITTGHWKQP